MSKYNGYGSVVRPEDLSFPDFITHEPIDRRSGEATIENQLEEARKLLAKTMSRQCAAEKTIEECKRGQKELEELIAQLDEQLKQQRRTRGLSAAPAEADDTLEVIKDNGGSVSRNSQFSIHASSLQDTAKNIWESRRPAWNGFVQSFSRYASDTSRQFGNGMLAASFRPPLVGAL